ncbi:hypothetical protein EW026_g7261 [Hermanssonia centrifuga]|uniref:Uncharacterized protein n=1 Tax=Hermanssonia centrifuga TaxID=98765 RepID=A0A4S4K8M0_9APHY|nr:hypothetical protein EW026_g7261 [Hermanssonia centrifuga]
MQFKPTFSVLAAIVLSMASVKLATASPVVETRAAEVDGDLYACTDANWAGQCENLGFYNGQCENFPADLQDDISSIGPDAGWVCVLYINDNCDGSAGSLIVTSPGFDQLQWGNDALSSFVCTTP